MTARAALSLTGATAVDVLVDRIRGSWRARNSVIRPSAKDVIASVSALTDAVKRDS